MKGTVWPPRGYSKPRTYETNDWMPYLVAILSGGITLLAYWDILDKGADPLSEFIINSLIIFGLVENEITLILGVLGALLLIFIVAEIGWKKVLTPIHEEIHYRVSEYLGLEPEHTETVLKGMVNQSVTNWKTGITKMENILSLCAPLVLIGVLFGILSFVTTGFIAGISALIVITNTAGSGGDIYHIFKILIKPEGTLFANFEPDDGGLRTEYVVPLTKPAE